MLAPDMAAEGRIFRFASMAARCSKPKWSSLPFYDPRRRAPEADASPQWHARKRSAGGGVMRTSPVHDCLSRLRSEWGQLNGMPIALRIRQRVERGAATGRPVRAAPDRAQGSGRRRLAACAQCSGARASEFLECAARWRDSIARLGRSEFLVEDGLHGSVTSARRARACDRLQPSVYPVLRQDAALMMRGEAVHELLAQTCSIDLLADAAARARSRP